MKSFYPLVLGVLLMLGCAQKKAPEQAPQTAQTVDYATEPTAVNPVLTGTKIPEVMVKNMEGHNVDLYELISQKPTVLIFYRGGWCPYCNKHMAQLQQAEKKLVEMGYQILAISPDQPKYLKQSMGKHDLDYTLLSDSPMEAAKAFGLAFKLDDATLERYKEYDLDLAERSGYNHHLLPVPAVFLVDTSGMIHFQYVNPDYKTRINSNVLLTAAEEYYPAESTASGP